MRNMIFPNDHRAPQTSLTSWSNVTTIYDEVSVVNERKSRGHALCSQIMMELDATALGSQRERILS